MFFSSERSRHCKTKITFRVKTPNCEAISSFIKRLRLKEKPVFETFHVIVCQDTLNFPKIFLWTEHEPFENPDR